MQSAPRPSENLDSATVAGFGYEWETYNQEQLSESELHGLFDRYFSIFPFESVADGEGFDLGCGSGRWALLAAKRVGHLHCIDPSSQALDVARRRLSGLANVSLHEASADTMPLADESQDFGYSLGVLHHVPDTRKAMQDAVRKLKPGAPFLVYLYYSFDNRPAWFRIVWKASDVGRRIISKLPFGVRKGLTSAIAALVYWPLSRTAAVMEWAGVDVANFPLSGYRVSSFYSLRTDAFDRFATPLEQRFSRAEIEAMMRDCSLTDVRFREDVPFWVACGRKAHSASR